MKQFILLILLIFCSFKAFSLEVPVFNSYVVDLTEKLSVGDKNEISGLAKDLYKKEIAQIGFLVIPSLEGEILEEYSIKVANTVKLGSKDKDNGLLVLVSMREKKIRIEVGSGLEGLITDIQSSRIIDGMKPYMRNGDLKGALISVINKVNEFVEYNSPEKVQERKELAEKQKKEAEKQKKEAEEAKKAFASFMYYLLIIVLIIYFVVVAFKYASLKDNSQSYVDKIEEKRNKIEENKKIAEVKENENKKISYEKDKIVFHELLKQEKNILSSREELANKISYVKNYIRRHGGNL